MLIINTLLEKQELTTNELHLLSGEMDNKRKTAGVTWALWWFLGIWGGHRFYLGKPGTGVAMLCTFGGFGIWWFIDMFLMNSMIRETNEKAEKQLIQQIKLMKKAKENDLN